MKSKYFYIFNTLDVLDGRMLDAPLVFGPFETRKLLETSLKINVEEYCQSLKNIVILKECGIAVPSSIKIIYERESI
jgi:hypothetical protein